MVTKSAFPFTDSIVNSLLNDLIKRLNPQRFKRRSDHQRRLKTLFLGLGTFIDLRMTDETSLQICQQKQAAVL